jgi:hypothetical protein
MKERHHFIRFRRATHAIRDTRAIDAIRDTRAIDAIRDTRAIDAIHAATPTALAICAAMLLTTLSAIAQPPSVSPHPSSVTTRPQPSPTPTQPRDTISDWLLRLHPYPQNTIADRHNFTAALISDRTSNLSGYTFLKPFKVNRSTFEAPCCFAIGPSLPDAVQGAHFKDTVRFESDTFRQRSDFRSSQFDNCTGFTNDSICHPIDFTYSRFCDSVRFVNTRFCDTAYFNLVHFGKLANFSHCIFSHIAFFSNLDLSDSTIISFDYATLPDTLDFSSISYIENPIDLEAAAETVPGHPHYIYLCGTDISKLKLNYSDFRLLFKDPKDPKHPDLSPQKKQRIYEELLENFKRTGRTSDYLLLNEEYEAFNLASLPWIDRIWYVYSSKASGVVGMTLIVFFLLSLINIFFYRRLNTDIYHINRFSLVSPECAPRPALRWIAELMNSLVYTGIIFFSLTLELSSIKFDNRRLLTWFLSIYVLGVIALFFLTHLLFR